MNTYKLIKMVLDGVKKSRPDAETDMLTVSDYDLSPCVGCCDCLFKEPWKCIQKDDLPKIQKKILDADAFVVGTPVYEWQLTGTLKILMDRTVTWTHAMPLTGRYGVVANTIAAPGFCAADTNEYLKRWMTMIGLTVVGELAVYARAGYEAMGKDNIPIEDHRGVREDAFELAEKLVSAMEEKPTYLPTGDDLRRWNIVKEKVEYMGGDDLERWKNMGWLDKAYWSL